MTRPRLPYRKELLLTPAQHLGYVFIVAYFAEDGMSADQIRKKCEAAHEAKAPKDVVLLDERGNWLRRGEFPDVFVGRRLDAYARVLHRHAEQLDAERKAQR